MATIMVKNFSKSKIDNDFIPPPTKPKNDSYNGKPGKKINIDNYKIQGGQVIQKRG